MDDPEQQVRDLLTQAEYAIFVASLPASVPSLSDRELRGEITRCRQARDKYRDLYNERTSRKADVFDDALDRLEQGLVLRQSEDAPTAPPDVNRAARRAVAESERGSVPTFVNDAAVDAYRRSSSLAGPTTKHISAARSAAGKRFQAKKDGR